MLPSSKNALAFQGKSDSLVPPNSSGGVKPYHPHLTAAPRSVLVSRPFFEHNGDLTCFCRAFLFVACACVRVVCCPSVIYASVATKSIRAIISIVRKRNPPDLDTRARTASDGPNLWRYVLPCPLREAMNPLLPRRW